MRKQFLGGCLVKHLLGQKCNWIASNLPFEGLLVQKTFWRFTDNPLWQSVLFIQQQGLNWQAPLVLPRPQLLCGGKNLQQHVPTREMGPQEGPPPPYLQLLIWENCPLWNIYCPRHIASWNSYGSLGAINCFKSYLTLLCPDRKGILRITNRFAINWDYCKLQIKLSHQINSDCLSPLSNRALFWST